jgi:curli biogenesis system outer membrane secretion channel CsgG
MSRGIAGLVIVLGAVTAIAQEQGRESATVIRQGPGGEIQILSTEKSAPAQAAAPAVPREVQPAEASASEAPRKARVMVIPAVFAQERRRRIDRELNERFGITDPGVIESPGYTSYLIDALVNVRKFDMLEREELRQVVRELTFGESEYVDIEKVVKIGHMVGADYMIIPEIRYLEVDRETKDVPYIGGQQVAVRSKLATNVRTVDVATGKIIASSVREVEKKKRQRQQDSLRILVMDTIAEGFKESALLDAAKLVDVAYPIRIVNLDGDRVTLNRGLGAILKDEVLKVYAAGEMMIDPETKETLGYQEAYVGAIRVTEVDSKTSKGVIIDRKGDINRLSICHRVENPTLDDPRLKQMKSPAPKID